MSEYKVRATIDQVTCEEKFYVMVYGDDNKILCSCDNLNIARYIRDKLTESARSDFVTTYHGIYKKPGLRGKFEARIIVSNKGAEDEVYVMLEDADDEKVDKIVLALNLFDQRKDFESKKNKP